MEQRKILMIAAVIGLLLILILWVTKVKADCISNDSWNLINQTMNSTGVNMTPLFTDINSICLRMDTLNQTLKNVASTLNSVNTSLNLTIGNISMAIANLNSSYNLTTTSINTSLNSTISSLNATITNLNSVVSMLNTIPTSYMTVSNMTSVTDAISSINQSIYNSMDKLESKIPKASNTYLWIGLGVVLIISVGLSLMNRRD
jgi:uncharacterized protein YoxC